MACAPGKDCCDKCRSHGKKQVGLRRGDVFGAFRSAAKNPMLSEVWTPVGAGEASTSDYEAATCIVYLGNRCPVAPDTEAEKKRIQAAIPIVKQLKDISADQMAAIAKAAVSGDDAAEDHFLSLANAWFGRSRFFARLLVGALMSDDPLQHGKASEEADRIFDSAHEDPEMAVSARILHDAMALYDVYPEEVAA